MNDKDNIILFPTNRIKDKKNVGKNVDDKEHRKIVEQQTKEFVEGNVDEIAYTLLDRFVKMGIRTDQLTFTRDLALVIDAIRGLVYRDFNKTHPMQAITDSFINIATTKEGRKLTDINYNKILKIKKPQPKEPDKSVDLEFDFDLE